MDEPPRRYTYRFSHEESETTTFLCEGCGGRFPVSRLWQRIGGPGHRRQFVPMRQRLEQGTWHGSGPWHYVYPMVCSVACLERVPIRTLQEWEAAHPEMPRQVRQLLRIGGRRGLWP